MTENNKNYSTIIIASFLLLLAVAFGAFGAHGLEGKVSDKLLQTYKTGVTYHFYHSLGLLIVGFLQTQFPISKKSPLFFIAGIILFSFNCYLYTFTGLPLFAYIVPLGGVSFLLGWLVLGYDFIKISKS